MRRDEFLKSMVALAAAGALPLSAHAAEVPLTALFDN